MESLLRYIGHYVNLTPHSKELVANTFKVTDYQKGHILFNEGDICRNLYFIINGVCRTYHDHDKKEITTWIYPESYFVTAWSSFIFKQPSLESVQVLEDSRIASITKDSLNLLYDQDRLIERFGRHLAEEQLALLDDYSRGYDLKSAKEKYQSLLSFFPDVTQRVNLGYIASMLGITQETLSRIRRNV